jgi:hypothetical protein
LKILPSPRNIQLNSGLSEGKDEKQKSIGCPDAAKRFEILGLKLKLYFEAAKALLRFH